MDLLAVLVLFQWKDVFVEELLKFLVGKVDAKLLKPVHRKVLKAEDIENSNESKLVLPTLDTSVDFLQDPAEEVGIDTHGSGVTRVSSLRGLMEGWSCSQNDEFETENLFLRNHKVLACVCKN